MYVFFKCCSINSSGYCSCSLFYFLSIFGVMTLHHFAWHSPFWTHLIRLFCQIRVLQIFCELRTICWSTKENKKERTVLIIFPPLWTRKSAQSSVLLLYCVLLKCYNVIAQNLKFIPTEMRRLINNFNGKGQMEQLKYIIGCLHRHN